MQRMHEVVMWSAVLLHSQRNIYLYIFWF